MIFAAGLGTRLKPLTDTMPKAMVTVGGRPLLRHVIDRLAAAGIKDIVVNVHHFAQQIVDYVAPLDGGNASGGERVTVSDETDLLRETGGALRHAAPLLRDDYTLVHNVDILSNTDLAAFASNLACDARLLVSERPTQRYLLFDDDMRLVGWTNIKTGEVKTPYDNLDIAGCRRLAFAGIHIIGRTLIGEMDEWPERFSVIDYYLAKCRTHRIEGYVQPGLRLLDVGKADTLAEAEEFLQIIANK